MAAESPLIGAVAPVAPAPAPRPAVMLTHAVTDVVSFVTARTLMGVIGLRW
jgi:hypothetical protein